MSLLYLIELYPQNMAEAEGLEPSTRGLEGRCSTLEPHQRILLLTRNSSMTILFPLPFLHSRREPFIKDMNDKTTSFTPRRGMFHLEHPSHPCLILRTKAGKTNFLFFMDVQAIKFLEKTYYCGLPVC